MVIQSNTNDKHKLFDVRSNITHFSPPPPPPPCTFLDNRIISLTNMCTLLAWHPTPPLHHLSTHTLWMVPWLTLMILYFRLNLDHSSVQDVQRASKQQLPLKNTKSHIRKTSTQINMLFCLLSQLLRCVLLMEFTMKTLSVLYHHIKLI